MKVQPVASPHQIQQAPSSASSRVAAAVAAFNGGGSPQTPAAPQTQAPANHSPQLNQNVVSAEDMGAIIPKANLEDVSQTDTPATEEAPKAEAKPQVSAEELERSRRFAQLARQEKALRQEVQQLKAREEALKAREAELQAQNAKYSDGYYSRDQIKADAMRVLSEAGISYDDIVQQAISQPAMDPRTQAQMDALKAEIDRLKQFTEDSKKNAQEQQTQQYQAAVKQITADVNQLVFTDPEFELIKVTKSQRDVVELIEKTFQEDGTLLSVEDAAREVEKYLTEEAEKLTKVQKIQKRLSSQSNAASAPSQQAPVTQPKQPQPMKTLTNATASTRPLSARERAILAFKGERRS